MPKRTKVTSTLPDPDLLPRDEGAERALIGAILLGDDVLWSVLGGELTTEDFHFVVCQRAFSAAAKVAERFEPVNQVSVAYEAEPADQERRDQLHAELCRMVADTPTVEPGHVRYWANIIRENAIRRRMIGLSAVMCRDAYAGKAAEDIRATVWAGLTDLQRTAAGLRETARLLEAEAAALDVYEENPAAMRGVGSGFADLDRVTRGFGPGELIIVAARTSIGKSQFTLSVCENVARNCGPVGYFSLEMSTYALVERLLSKRAGIDPVAVMRRGWEGDERDRFRTARRALASLPLWIDDTPGLDTATIRARAARFKAEHPDVKLLAVDYCDLLTDKAAGDKHEALRRGAIAQALRAMGRELGLPVILVCQLNRESEGRQDKTPAISDIAWSDELARAADTILLLHRPEDAQGTALNVIIGKQRQGPQAKVQLYYQASTGRMTGLQRVS